MIITSDRKFGVEVEFFCPSPTSLRRISNMLNVVGDGSLRHIPNSGEYVSDILHGKSGEHAIYRACEILKKYNASGDDISMSVHVHHDGKKKRRGELVSSKEEPVGIYTGRQLYAFSNKLARSLSSETIEAILDGLPYTAIQPSVCRSVFGNTVYFSLGELVSKPEKNFTFYWLDDNSSRFKWLRNVLFFYTQYSAVMENIVSNSRKFGNMYCIPLGASYTLDEIRSVTSMRELRSLWYRGNESGDHYDDSRYHNVNLHSFWNRHGTVEIRSHGGTVDPNKILLWTKLHQKIMDKLENMEIVDFELSGEVDINAEFVKFIEEPVLQSYVKRLLGFYSNIIIK